MMSNYLFKKTKRIGFSLIELLIVIAIIGLLASMIFVNVSSARAHARDAKRIHDFEQFRIALELFFAQYKKYPCGDSYDGNIHVDGSMSCPFLDGNAGSVSDPNYNGCNPPHEQNIFCTDYPTFGIHTVTGYYPIFDFRSYPYSQPPNDYSYQADQTRQTYRLAVRLEVSTAAMQNDGGACPNWYEVGPGKNDQATLGFTCD